MENFNKKNKKEEIITHALKYLDLGLSVMPLGGVTKKSDGQKDITYVGKWKQYQTLHATTEEIKKWHYENIGIVSGPISGILVLDLDIYKPFYDKELAKSLILPITPTSQTANGGQQLFFKYPKGINLRNDVSIGHKESGIDVRADGGMVIAPPTKTSYGEYTWLVSPFDTPFADIPPKLLELLGGQSEGTIVTKKALPELVGLQEGAGRNTAMTSFIGTLLWSKNFEKWETEVWPTAMQVNNTYKPPLDISELRGIYESVTKIEQKRRLNPEKKESEKEITLFISAMTHAELIMKQFPPARYTLEPFFEQGTMNMLSAPPNTWKSWLLFYFALHIARGTMVLDKFATEQSAVMIVNEEDSARLIQDRLRSLNITDSELPIYYRIAHGSKLTKEFVQNLIREAKEKNVGVIMFDSLRAIHEADENDSTGMQAVMDLLKMIARENITVIFTHHHRKKQIFGKGDDADASRGSSAINAAVSGHLSLEEVQKDDGKYLVVRHLKSKAGEKLPPFDIAIQIEDGVVSFQYMGDHKPKEQALTEARSRILNELQEREELLGRKDFVFLKVGGATTVKAATAFLENSGEIKMITRKEAIAAGMRFFNNTGKVNEALYYIPKEKNLDDFDEWAASGD